MRRVVFNQKAALVNRIACNLAAISAFEGYRSLLIDLDAREEQPLAPLARAKLQEIWLFERELPQHEHHHN